MKEIFPEFKRHTAEHETLRKLRDLQLIRPVEGGSWRDYKRVEIKEFGLKLIRIKEDFFFPPKSK